MLLFLDDEDLQDAEFMSELEDELKEAEKICKAYGYESEFFIDYKKKYVRGDIYEPRNDYSSRIYIEDEKKFDIEIQTASYGSLSMDEYNEFLNACKKAMNLAHDLYSNFIICRQLVKD